MSPPKITYPNGRVQWVVVGEKALVSLPPSLHSKFGKTIVIESTDKGFIFTHNDRILHIIGESINGWEGLTIEARTEEEMLAELRGSKTKEG